MYPVSQLFKEKIQELDRVFQAKIQIHHSEGILELDEGDLIQGTLIFNEATQSGENFTIGEAIASNIQFTIVNKPEYDDIQFIGATIYCNIGLLVREAIDAHFLQPSQPSKMLYFDDVWEFVPLGVFHIDEVNRQRNTIEIKAIDNMIKFERPYSLSQLTYPATLYQIYLNACNICGVHAETTSFPNMNYTVQERPEGDLTCRDIISYVAQLAGCFAKCNRNGALELKWYQDTDVEIRPINRFSFKPSDDVIQITGVMYETEDAIYLAGTDEYVINISENPLVNGEYSNLLNNIYNNIKDTLFIPYSCEWQGNPAIEAGDKVTHIDRDDKVYNTIVTKSTFKFRGKSTLEAAGTPQITKGYKGTVEKFKSTANKQIAQAKNIAEEAKETVEEVEEQITLLEQAQINANNLIANMLGGYYIEDKENGIIYVADNPNINQATKIWRWGLGGFGYSDDGGQTWKTAITADGSIVAMLVAANIITADMIQAGKLQSQNGQVYFDLDGNEFRTPNIVMDSSGITVENGAIVVKDLNNSNIITANGLKVKYVFISSGELKGWQKVGIWNEYGNVLSHHAFITAAIPDNLTIETAVLRCKSMPRLFTGWGDVPDGYYHARNMKLYKISDESAGYIDYPAASEYDLIMDIGGTDISSAVWGSSTWSPTGQGIKYRQGDVKNYLDVGTNIFLVKSTDSISQATERYGGGIQFELIITGYLRGD